MTRPLIPANEIERLQALQRTNLLDSSPEERFDRITRLVARYFNVKTCLLSLVDENRQWFKSKVGLNATETDRDISFCGHVILDHDTLVVCDATEDPRFASNPLVTGKPHIRFYAGAPICESGGFPIGTLCIIDPSPREFSDENRHLLRDFANMVEEEIARFDQTELQQKRDLNALRASSIEIKAQLELLSEVAKQTTNGVVITDKQGLVVWINEAFTDITGYTLDEVIGLKPGSLLQGVKTQPDTIEVMHNALAQNMGFDVDVLNYSKTKCSYWVRVICTPMTDQHDNLKGYIAVQTDITQQKKDAEVIRNNQHLLKAVIDTNNIGTWHLNMQTDELLINDKWAEMLGYTLQELEPIDRYTWEHLTHPDDLAYCAIQLKKHVQGETPAYEANVRMQHKNGKWLWVHTQGRISSFTSDGKVDWLLGTHFDINAQMAAENTLNEQSMKTQAIVENMLDGVITIDDKGIIKTFNRAAEVIFGYSRDELLGHNVNLLMGSPHHENHNSYLTKHMSSKNHHVTGRNRELEAKHKNGTLFPIELGLVQVIHGDEITFVGIVRDITHRKQRDHDIHQLAFYDPLTKLPNRRLLVERLQLMLDKCSRHKRYGAVLFLDLDNFKNLNDSSGHNKGDLLLTQVAQRLTKSVRQSDTVSRWGGDEFVIVIEELSAEKSQAANQAEKAADQIIAQLTQRYDLDGLAYIGSASIGVTLFNSDNLSIEELLKQADMAMYKAKLSGRNCIQFFDPDMQNAVSHQAAMENDLHDAIKSEQFVLYYQKQVDQEGRTLGAEVLLRWLHPLKGIISPAEFIPLTESSGLIIPIGKWVLLKACETLVLWSADPATSELEISVNISVVQFSHKDFVSTVLNVIEETGADPRHLKLEITESLLANNIQEVKAKMLALQQRGITFSIDDFGTGYSSLSYLQQLPIDQLKIDQSFIRDIRDNPNNQAIAQAVITLAASMNLNVIAEGVETHEQQRLLQEMGCNAYQGYFFGKPCELDKLMI